MKKILLFSMLCLVVSFSACRNSTRFAINTDKNRVEVKIKRYDSLLLSIDTSDTRKGVEKLYKQYPEFTRAFAYQILDTTARDTNEVTRLLHLFLTDQKYTPAYVKTKQLYANVNDLQKELSDAFTTMHYYFPKMELPEIYFFVSGFNSTMLLNRKFIAVGLDMYLGSDFPLYKQLTYSYMITNMKKENITSDITSVVLQRYFMHNNIESTLLDNIIFKGKILYLLSVFLPEKKPEILMGYTEDQWKWSKKFEKDIWMRMIDNKDLFSTDVQLISRYLNEAPFTAPISQQAPGRLGSFIGWQIVNSYMNKNKELTLDDLMKEENGQKILQLSGYKP